MHIIRFFLSPLHRKFKKQKTSHGRASILCTYYLNSSTEGWKKMKKKRILKINAVIFNFYETYQCIFYKKMFRHRAHNETTNNNSIGSSCHHMNRDNSAYESKKKRYISRVSSSVTSSPVKSFTLINRPKSIGFIFISSVRVYVCFLNWGRDF